MTTTALNGWFKALSADNKGWDGWIRLSGSGYGPTISSGGVFTGHAWGSDVVGWLQFDAGSAPVSTTWLPCTANYYCVGNSQYYQDGMCVSTLSQVCSQGYTCSAGVCNAPPPPAGSLAGGAAMTIKPTLVKLNGTAAIVWGVNNVISCTVTGTNKDGTAASTNATSPGVWNTTSGTKTSSPILKQTTYSLICTDLTGKTSTISTINVSLVPRWLEL